MAGLGCSGVDVEAPAVSMVIDWEQDHAAIWRHHRASLHPVRCMDPVTPDELVGIDAQKVRLLRNTERFLEGLPANHALLWGARGTGKSSLIKAVFNHCRGRGLRLVEVDKEDLVYLPDIVDGIRDLPQRFVIYCDDLSFVVADRSYKSLKVLLEGSIELPPSNVVLYATSNRRHLLPEPMQDNRDTLLKDGELHYPDAVEEKISLSDRFGLWLSFYPIGMQGYLQIVDSLFPDYSGARSELHEAARLFAIERASRSGRTARQFFNSYTRKRRA